MTPSQQLADWIAMKHNDQVIKRSGAPYFSHLLTVAEIAGQATPLGYEIGLCHDLLEDTSTTEAELLGALIRFGYAVRVAEAITSGVVELTDVFTRKAYPSLSKAIRKKKEHARLLTVSAIAQTVKYADIADNINWVLKYDPKHAKTYLVKKQLLLAGLDRGAKKLRKAVLDKIRGALLTIQED